MESVKGRKFISLVIAVLLLAYVGYQVYLINKKGLETETAMYATLADTLQTTGFIAREEQIIDSVYSGVLNYNVPDGSRVSQGGVIAEIYANEHDATSQGKIDRIDNEISMLKSLSNPGGNYIANPEYISAQINGALNSMFHTIKTGDYHLLSSRRDEFQMALNRKNIITGVESTDDYSLRIAELEMEKNTVLNSTGSLIDQVRSPVAGYFISKVDGFENRVDLSKVGSLTVNEVKDILSWEQPAVDSYSVGKVSREFNWYLIANLSKDDMVKMGNATNVTVEIPFATAEKIPAEVVAKNRDSVTGEAALILRCSYMDSDIAGIRKEIIQVNVRSYSGVLVNEKSIRFEDIEKTETDELGNTKTVLHENVKGVYVKKGDQIEFVQIFTEKAMNGYAICKTELSDQEKELLVTAETIQLYDEIVIGGTDLYDGKLIY